MLSRRDLIQSRQYLHQRQIKALVSHRPDPLDWAGRHAGGTIFAGIMLLAIALGATAVIGLVFPSGSRAWQSCESVIVEKESGAPYVCDATARTLYPTANYTSAALIMGGTASVKVARASLTWPKGALLGLPGAPGDLVPAKNYLSGAWSLCTVLRRDTAGRPTPVTVILAGTQPDTPTELAERAILLAGPDGTRYVLWSGRRYPVREPQYVLPALGFSVQQGLAVGDAWLAPIPLGATLGPIAVTGLGEPAPKLDGVKVGQIVQVGDRAYVVRREGLQEVTPLQRILVRRTHTDPVTLDQGRLAGVDILPPMTFAGSAPPPNVPEFAAAADDGIVCANMLADQLTITTGGGFPARIATVVPRRASGRGGMPLADAILVEPGHAVMVRSMASSGATGGPLMLISDLGVRHAVPDDRTAAALGYAGTPVLLPSSLLDRLPEGVALDPQAARQAAVTPMSPVDTSRLRP
ncbi:MAG: type VII secretion protein EccB [Hamadaea sp.]|uniref:type VII secretion protein EccB n=1 Tax=Hamadaea sp. TaxID=2024425 RepID=UPI0017C1659C|nr:type VII secretion protein EccB [Hamadaea sp.]NUT20408.1 type VII secretion protein EccB [Hamadaea sp.]